MIKSAKIISILVGMAAILIAVSFFSPSTKPDEGDSSQMAAQQEPNDVQNTLTSQAERLPQEAPDTNTPRVPDDTNIPGISVASTRLLQPQPQPQPDNKDLKEPEKTSEPNEPNDPMVAVHINNMEMKNIMSKLMEWTGKSIIPSNEAMKARITVFTPDKLPRSKALQLIYNTLKEQGYIVEQYDEDTLKIKQITDAVKLSMVPIIDSNTPLAAIQNKEQIVQKFFQLSNYTPSQMGQVLIPMLGEYGNLSADDDARILSVIDTVSTLMRMELVIHQFDKAAAEPMVEKIFEIHYRNPSDVIQLLSLLIHFTSKYLAP